MISINIDNKSELNSDEIVKGYFNKTIKILGIPVWKIRNSFVNALTANDLALLRQYSKDKSSKTGLGFKS